MNVYELLTNDEDDQMLFATPELAMGAYRQPIVQGKWQLIIHEDGVRRWLHQDGMGEVQEVEIITSGPERNAEVFSRYRAGEFEEISEEDAVEPS